LRTNRQSFLVWIGYQIPPFLIWFKRFFVLKFKITNFWKRYSTQFAMLLQMKWLSSRPITLIWQPIIHSICGKIISVITLVVVEKMKIDRKVLYYKVLQIPPTPSYLEHLNLQNGSSVWAEMFSFCLTLLDLPTVKISTKLVTSIEQRSAGTGRGLDAMFSRRIWYWTLIYISDGKYGLNSSHCSARKIFYFEKIFRDYYITLVIS
jgi:hypothetical protein